MNPYAPARTLADVKVGDTVHYYRGYERVPQAQPRVIVKIARTYLYIEGYSKDSPIRFNKTTGKGGDREYIVTPEEDRHRAIVAEAHTALREEYGITSTHYGFDSAETVLRLYDFAKTDLPKLKKK